MYNNYYVYILSNNFGSVYYTGVTNDLERRINEHREGKISGFTKKYNCHKLLYFETYSDIEQALEREKKLKKLSRINKDKLINTINPERKDLLPK
jgi:putative endonuclease